MGRIGKSAIGMTGISLAAMVTFGALVVAPIVAHQQRASRAMLACVGQEFRSIERATSLTATPSDAAFLRCYRQHGGTGTPQRTIILQSTN